jgi:hypothetical protein
VSCDWDVYCLDCESEHGFSNCNHEDKLMRELAKLGPRLKKLCELMPILDSLSDPPCSAYVCPRITLDADVIHPRRWLHAAWWIEHGGHRLVARDEYGRCDDECGEHFSCGECGSSKCCRRMKGHDGEHKDKRDDAKIG